VAQGLLFAGAGGADPAQIPVALAGGHADSRVLQEHGRRMINRPKRLLERPGDAREHRYAL